MIEPLRMRFTVECSAEHAFFMWTERTTMWWPLDHTVSEQRGLAIVIEPNAGGRMFERTADGTEHDWGRVTAWEPPRRLAYLWHLGAQASEATDVQITFEDAADGTAVVEIVHGGWERLGERAEQRREGNHRGWTAVFAPFAAAISAPAQR